MNQSDEPEPFEINTETFHGGSKRPINHQMSFVNYITTFTSKEKSQILNMFQYGAISIIPLIALLKLMKLYVPSEDPFKPTTDILIEVLIQLVVILVTLFLIHKVIIYFPTYSKMEYDSISLLGFVMPIFFLMFTLDTKISEKLNILFDRLLIALGIKRELMSNMKPETTTRTVATNGTPHEFGQPSHMALPNRLLPGNPTQREQSVDSSLLSNMNPQGPSGGFQGEMTMDHGPVAANEAFGGSSLF
jgi:hypothetical protein